MYSSQFFWVRCIVRHVVEIRKSGTSCFLYRSLLLSIIALNDVAVINYFTNMCLVLCTNRCNFLCDITSSYLNTLCNAILHSVSTSIDFEPQYMQTHVQV